MADFYQRLDEHDDDAARWLQDLATERALIGIVLAIARTLPFPHPEAVSMAKSLIELGWWVSSASGDSHWRIGRKMLSNKAQMAELAIREQSVALTMDIFRAVCELKRQLPESGSEPAQEVA